MAVFDIGVTRTLGARRFALSLHSDARLVVLTGLSGGGKTSMLNMIAGLLTPDSGHIRVAGRTLFDAAAKVNLPPEARHIGYAFQDNMLFPHLSVRENLGYGVARRSADANAAAVMSVSDMAGFLGIEGLMERRPDYLSGGEARRVAIGRALLSAPRLLLLDEPLSGIDPARGEEILQLIERIRDTMDMPIIHVSHSAAETARLAPPEAHFAVE